MNARALGEWFVARGQRAVCLREQDVQQLQPVIRRMLLLIVDRMPEASITPDGYRVLPCAALCDGRFTELELGALQEVVGCYREIRHAEGYPTVAERCGCVEGCVSCGGTRMVRVLKEMSDRERQLSYD